MDTASSRKEMMAMENVGKKFGGNILPSGKGKVVDLARRLRRAQQIAQIGYWELSLVDDQHFWSEEIIELLGSTKNGKQFDEKFFFRHIHPSDTEKLKKRLRTASHNNEEQQVVQFRIIKDDTKEIHNVEAKFIGAKENGSEVVRIEGTLQNIDERVYALDALAESKIRLEKAFEVADIGSYKYMVADNRFVWSKEGVFVAEFEDESCPITFEEYATLIHPEDKELFLEQSHNIGLNQSYTFEYRLKCRSGYKWINSTLQRFEGDTPDTEYVIGVIRDIDKVKQEQLQKEAINKHLQTGAELARLGYWEFDFSKGKYLFNDQFFEIFKTSVSQVGTYEMTAQEYMDTFFPKDKEGLELKERFINLMAERKVSPVNEIEHKVIFGNGEEGYVAVRSTPIMDDKGTLVRILGAVQDVTKKVREQQKLEISANKLQTGADMAHLGYWELDYSNFMYTFNDQFYKVLKTTVEAQGGYQLSPQEYVDRFFREEEGQIQKKEVLNLLLTAQQDGNRETHHAVTFGDGTHGYVSVVSKPIYNSEGNITGRFGAIQDVTKSRENQRKLQQALDEIEEHFHQFRVGGDLAKVGHWSMDLKENQYTFSDQFYKVYRTSVEEIGGYTMSPEEYMRRFNIAVNVNELKDSDVGYFSTNKVTEPVRHFHKLTFGDGEDGYVAVLSIPIYNEEGEVVKLIGANQDVTDQEKRKQQLEIALEEKVTLLSEVHHRVKNNLALISGLLQLQTMYSAIPQLNSKLQQSTTRIKSIALVHELLYQSAHLTSINIKEYLTKVIPTLEATYAPIGIDVELTIESDDHEININQAVPVGLLLNELITNSYQYAFNSRSRGIINISLHTIDDMVHMCYRDDGVGIPTLPNVENATSLGFTLIKSQLEQLSANYTFDTRSGFKLEFSFSESDRGSHSNV